MIVTQELCADCFLERQDAGDRDIFCLAFLHGLGTGTADIFRCVEIRLSGIEGNDIHAGFLQSGNGAFHFNRRRRLDLLDANAVQYESLLPGGR